MPCLERWGIFNNKIMTRIDILNQQLGLLNTEKLTAVGARLRQVNRRIEVIQNVLIKDSSQQNSIRLAAHVRWPGSHLLCL